MEHVYEVAVDLNSSSVHYSSPQYYYVSAENLTDVMSIAQEYACKEWKVTKSEIVSIKKLGKILTNKTIQDIKNGTLKVRVK